MGLCPILSAVKACAMVKTPSPSDDTVCPDQSSVKSRTLSVSNVLGQFVARDTAIHTFT
jgi:hypothetical protein